ncbi:MAG TPA: hypothetical protein VII73_10660 [Caulobacteraceae bacterium]
MPQGIEGQGSAPPSQIAQFRSDGITAATGLRLPFFSDSFARAYGFPEMRLKNMISEATPVREERPFVPLVGLREIRYSRPGLVSAYSIGTGPIRGLYCQAGVFGSALFVVSGAAIYNAGTGANLGTIPGTDLVRFAASGNQMVAVAGGVVYLYGGSGSFAPISGVLPPVSDVAYIAGRFVYACAGTNIFYYSQVNDAANVPGLNFESAETAAGPIVGMGVLNDELMVFCATVTQVFSPSGDPDTPFTPVEGRGYQRGCIAQGTISFMDNALVWVADNRQVYRSDNANDRISSHSIEGKIAQCANPSAMTGWTAIFEGHEIYVLNIPGVGSYGYDASRVGGQAGSYGTSASRGEWSEWASYGQATFRGQVCASLNGVSWVGDDGAGTVWTLQVGVYSDGTDPIERVASSFIKIESGTPRCLNIVLHCVQGVGNPTGLGSNPMVEMRYSDDEGRSFCRWRAAALGAVGAYRRQRVFWQRLGLLRAPGRVIEIRCTDPVNAAFSHLAFNEPRAAY